MKVVAAAFVVLLAACSSSSNATGGPATSSGAAPSPSPVGTTPTVVATPSTSPAADSTPVTSVDFSCRLPIMVDTAAGDNPGTFVGGFLSFPNATFTLDPRGGMQNTQNGLRTTSAAPVLTAPANFGRPFYDAVQNRWVPSDPALSSPDGASYAYVTTGASSADGATIHVVTVATGAERTVKIAIPEVAGAPVGVQLDDYDGSTAYFSVGQMENYPTGEWKVDLSSGHVTAMAQVGNVFAVRDGSAWSGAVDPGDPNPPTAPASVHFFDSIVQVDLRTGSQTTWFYRPGVAVTLLAVDAAGHPIVEVDEGPDFMRPTTTEIRRLNEPLSGGEDNGDLIYSGQISLDLPQPDGDRVWFGSDRGIYLYTSASGLQKVYAFSTAGQTIFPAGLCR